MSCLIKFLKGKCECTQVGLLILRILPGYFLLANHGWGKITHPEKWDGLGSAVTKYVGVIDFLNPMFGFLGAFSESICAGLVLIGLFTTGCGTGGWYHVFCSHVSHYGDRKS